ncbi:MAG: inositol monophosphatase family protein [Dehalococcoidia bacterium]
MTDGGLPLSRTGRRPMEVATQAIKEAGVIVAEHFGAPQKATLKGRGNLVTEVDLLAEKAILGLLRSEYPEHCIISEESDAVTTESPYTWIVDPLDGTNNYSFGLPFVSVTLALVRGEDILLGLTFDPLRQELFRAEKGKGAFLNDAPMAVSPRTDLQRSALGCDLGYDAEKGAQTLDFVRSLWPGMHSLRIMGSGALGLAYVASGRLEIYLHRFLYPWDVAGGILLIREAGGLVTDWQGVPVTTDSGEVVCANPVLHGQIMARIAPR